jgi:hypothetical protein
MCVCRLAACCAALLAVVLAADAAEAARAAAAGAAPPSPDGRGALPPRLLASACRKLLQGLRAAYGALCALRPGERDRSGDLQEHYDVLVQAAGALLARSPAFAAACRQSTWLPSLMGGVDEEDAGMLRLLEALRLD